MPAHPDKIARFSALHGSGCFLLPNPWDVGTARHLEALGFSALATTSAGFAFARGLPDAVGALELDAVLEHVRELDAATSLPLNVDFQAGYANDPDGVAESVTRCVAAGAAGLSIEDASGDEGQPLFSDDEALARVRAARAAIDATGTPVLLTARCEAHLLGVPNARKLARDRLVAFAEAGADCLYAPGLRDPAQIEELVRAVAPKPLNALMASPVEGLTFGRLADLGVRRVSVGSALARVAWGAFLRAARELAERGDFGALSGAATFDEIDELFRS